MSISPSLFNPAQLSREIIDSIYAELDHDAVIALGQVARVFRFHSQQLLYSIISLEDAKDCRDFHSLVEAVPDVSEFVRVLEISGQSDEEDSWPELPDILRSLTKITYISLVSLMWSPACHGAATRPTLKRIRCQSVQFDSLQSWWDLLHASSSCLEVLDAGDLTFDSQSLAATPPDAEENSLTMIILDIQTEDDVDMMNVLFGARSPLRLDNVERLWIKEIAVASSAKLITALQITWQALPRVADVNFGDLHGLGQSDFFGRKENTDTTVTSEDDLPPLNMERITEFSFVVVMTETSHVSPSLAWWAKNITRSRPEWETVKIVLKLLTTSSTSLQSLFPENHSSISAWTKLDLGLRCLRPGAVDASVTVQIQHSEPNSREDFAFMKRWVQKRLSMLDNRQLLHVEEYTD